MRFLERCLAGMVRGVIGLGLRLYFGRIERFHAERVPDTGPVPDTEWDAIGPPPSSSARNGQPSSR